MKKLGLLMVCQICGLIVTILTACVGDPAPYYFSADDFEGQIISVDLIDYNNPNVMVIRDENKAEPFDFEKMTIIESLAVESFDSFIGDFTKLEYMKGPNFSNAPVGINIKINCQDGNFIILGCAGDESYLDGYAHRCVAKYKDDGELDEYIGCFQNGKDLDALINKYFEVDI